MTTKTEDFSSIAKYMVFLADPAALVDQKAIGQKRKQLEGTTDPLEQMVFFDELCELEHPNSDQYEAGFIDLAQAWVKAAGIKNPVATFTQAGVPDKVISAAGFSKVRSRVSRNQIIESLPSGEFTVREAVTASGASEGSVAKAIKDLVEDGFLTARGSREGTTGRAPLLFEKV